MCPICKENESPILLDWKEYHIHKCSSCKLLFTLPLPSDETLQSFYQGFMFKTPESHTIQKEVAGRKKELTRLFDLKEGKHKSFLDYGGGTGASLRAAMDLGLDAYYYDIDEPAKQFCIDHFGMQNDQIIDSLEGSNMQYDYIFTDNVIEHIKDPIAFTTSLIQKLKPGGRLVIKTPNGGNTEIYFNPLMAIFQYLKSSLKYNSFFKSLRTYFKRSWHCDPPRHLYSFTPKSFSALEKSIGLDNLIFHTSFYGIKLWENTITKEYFTKDRKLSTLQSILYRIILLPVIGIEIPLQLLSKLCLRLGLISAGGLILTIDRD